MSKNKCCDNCLYFGFNSLDELQWCSKHNIYMGEKDVCSFHEDWNNEFNSKSEKQIREKIDE